MTSTKPSGTGVIIQQVGVALSATKYLFHPDVVRGFTIANYTSDVTTSGTSSETLITKALAAGILANEGDRIFASFSGSFAANTNDKFLWFDFAGTDLSDQIQVTQNGGAWSFEIEIVQVSSSTVRISQIASPNLNNGLRTSYQQLTGLTLANSLNLKLEGRTPASAGDLTIRSRLIRFAPAE